MALTNFIKLSSDQIQTLQRQTGIPYFIYNDEISGIYGSALLAELGSLIKYYEIYEKGSSFATEGSNGDYTPSQLRYKKIHSLIDKEARFLFAKTPDFWIDVEMDTELSQTQKQQIKQEQTILQNLVDAVIKENKVSSKLIKAAKDCFIGKRVALFINFNENGIKITFNPSLEFVFETDPEDIDVITKLVSFYTTVDSADKAQQRIYKKKYYIGEDKMCHIIEELYDGMGNVVETITPDTATRFSYIPAFVIINDGLSGDIQGVSEVDQLDEYEQAYSRLANADQDAERKGMNPVRYAIDMNPKTTQGLSTAAGAFWDLASDDQGASERVGTVGVLSAPMEYTNALTTTLNRIENTMYSQMDMPNTSPEALQGVVSSGKTLKAIYWGLIVRCDEKMLAWRPALESMVRTIIEGAKLYPEFCSRYTNGEALPDIEYSIRVDNQYPLPEDEAEEKQVDLAEVNAQTMSKKAYMVKWRGLTDDEALDELKQIALERQLLEDSFMPIEQIQPQGKETGQEKTEPSTGDPSSADDDTTPEGV